MGRGSFLPSGIMRNFDTFRSARKLVSMDKRKKCVGGNAVWRFKTKFLFSSEEQLSSRISELFPNDNSRQFLARVIVDVLRKDPTLPKVDVLVNTLSLASFSSAPILTTKIIQKGAKHYSKIPVNISALKQIYDMLCSPNGIMEREGKSSKRLSV